MKIALVTETFPPEVNGVAMTLNRLSTGLAKRGNSVTIICPGRPERKVNPNDLFAVHEVTGLPIPGYKDLCFGLPCKHKLQKLWQANRPDWVHVATEGPLGWSAVKAARAMGLPLVTSFHTNFDGYSSHYHIGLLSNCILKWMRGIHSKALLTYVPSADIQLRLQQSGFHNLQLMGRGVDSDLFNPARRDPKLRSQWGCGDNDQVALYVGRLAGEKNLPLTIAAWERMRSDLPNLKLVLVGDGPLREELSRKHTEIIFAGMRQGEDLAKHYASADVFLFASMSETFGNVVTEAMASGLTVLAYDYAAPGRYIQSWQNGVLCPFADEKHYLELAGKLSSRPSEWPALGQAAVETVASLSWDGIVSQYINTLDSLKSSSRYPAPH